MSSFEARHHSTVPAPSRSNRITRSLAHSAWLPDHTPVTVANPELILTGERRDHGVEDPRVAHHAAPCVRRAHADDDATTLRWFEGLAPRERQSSA